MQQKEWFEEWFDTKYYHSLYKHRDYNEAELFVNNISKYLKIEANQRVLDLACGKGRHAVTLNKLGYDVIGIDLSEQSIMHASQFENEKLHFYVNDIRKIFRTNYFNFVFNLFTSFGYFQKKHDNFLASKAITSSLMPNGKLVIDFINFHFHLPQINSFEKQILDIDGFNFEVSKTVEENTVIKNIKVKDGKAIFHFQEKLNILYQKDFESYFSNLKLIQTFGDYDLNSFDAQTSPRLIMVFEK